MRQDPRLRAAPCEFLSFPELKNRLSQPPRCLFALICRTVSIVSLLALLAAPGTQADARRDAARAQFEKAERQRIALQGKPQNQRTIEEYTQLVAAFRRVYLITPHAMEVPKALLAVAELYQDMGRRFSASYYQSSIDAYQFLNHEYPASRHRADALLTIARIQKDDLGQYDLAQKSFEEFLASYPQSERGAEARGAIAEIADARDKLSKPMSRVNLTEQTERENQLPQVMRIRTWNAENYTRIVVDLEDEVQYQAARLSEPDRIYFDLTKAKLNSALAGKTIEIQQGGFLKNVRVAQNQAGVVRVVLEVEKAKDYSVFLLPNPYRLVVDVYGETAVAGKRGTTRESEKSAKKPARPATPEKLAQEPTNSKSTAPKLKQPVPSEVHPTQRGSVQVSSGAGAADSAAVPTDAGTSLVQPKAPQPADSLGSAAAPRNAPGKGGNGKAGLPSREAAVKPGPPPIPAPTKNGQHSLTRALGLKIGRIVIDPGHGGHDNGTVGPTGLMEKDLCLDVALRLGRLIEQRLPGAEVVFTRQDDSFVPLEERTAIANQSKADLFLSVHANSSPDNAVRGVETYYLNFSASDEAMEVASRENALAQGSIHELQELVQKIARNEKIDESREFAMEVQVALIKRLQTGNRKLKNRGVRKAPFVVLIGANMPSVLSEISFLSNPTDERLLRRSDNRQRVAEGLYHGVESYLRSINSLTYNQSKTVTNNR